MSEKRILIADDDLAMRRLLTHALTPEFEVVEAADGVQALYQLEAGDIDLVLTDGDMPRMDGYRLIERLAAMRPGLPCLVLSGSVSEEQQQWLKAHGVPCLRKPFRSVELRQKIHHMVDAHSRR